MLAPPASSRSCAGSRHVCGRALARASGGGGVAARRGRDPPPRVPAVRVLHRVPRRRRRSGTPTRSRPSWSAPLPPSVVGDSSALKVHVHTDDPGRALSLGVARGTVAGVEIANMHEQRSAASVRSEPRPGSGRRTPGVPRRSGWSPAARATGGCSRASARAWSTGGRTMNPSTAELLAAVEADPAPRRERSSQRPQRVHGGGAARRERVEAGACRADRVASGRAGGDGRVRFGAHGRGPCRRYGCCGRRRRDRRRNGRLARLVQTNGVAVSKGAWLGLADGVPVAGGGSFDEVTLSPSHCSQSAEAS